MQPLDETDRRLITALTRDGRASVTQLAGDLGLARATVQNRLTRLTQTGMIRRFTVEVDPAAVQDAVRAVMLIQLQGTMSRAVTRALHTLPAITALHSTNGTWDLVAQIETANLPAFDSTLRAVRDIPGVLNSETCLLLDTA
ncbi:MAG: Lrp/AsnC family transcriptional regulator [Pseudomonadota bacterium]